MDKELSSDKEDPEVKIKSMKVADLKIELQLRCESINGKRTDLVQRLIKAHKLKLKRYGSKTAAAAAKISNTNAKARPRSDDHRSTSNRRLGSEPPRSTNSCKDKASRDHFKRSTEFIKKFQNLTTWRDEHQLKTNPKSQHFMLSYDQVVPKPYATGGSKQRVNPISVFLVPDHGFDVKEFGKHLITLGKQMVKNSGKGYTCTNMADEYSYLLFEE